jgi:hypothetical protein
MHLPQVFAIYRHNTQTFQLIMPKFGDDGNVVLTPWAPPTGEVLRKLSEININEAKIWLNGQEWYVEPTRINPSEINVEIHKIKVSNRTFYWWPLYYRLVWSKYEVHSRRFSIGEETWIKSPSIPIIEMSPGVIYPRTTYGFYPRWASVKPRDLEVISYSSRACLEQDSDYEREVTQNMRISTPKEKADNILDDESYYGIDDNSRCVTTISLLTMIFAFTGLYAYLITGGSFC